MLSLGFMDLRSALAVEWVVCRVSFDVVVVSFEDVFTGET